MTFKFAEAEARAKIKVFGVGGGGGNAVNTMVENRILGVEFIAGNTDRQDLEKSKADVRLQFGDNGLGAGAKPEVGQAAAEASVEEIRKQLQGCDMVFVTAGLGGGTGTGAAPVVARVAKEEGALTVAVVTKPFAFEGRARAKNAERGWEELKGHVDSIITIPNDRVHTTGSAGTTFIDAMKMVDDVLVQAVKGITDLINLPGYINPDFADVRAIMNEMGQALMGSGCGVGENRAEEAVNMAINSPLLQDISIDGARAVLVNISARQATLTMDEVTRASNKIYDEVHDEANIILGVTFDENLGDELQVTVIATGIRDAVDDCEEIAVPVRIEEIKRNTAGRLTRPGQPVQKAVANGSPGKAYGWQKFNEQHYDRPTFLRRNES